MPSIRFDAFIPPLLVLHTIGKIGCFMAGCCMDDVRNSCFVFQPNGHFRIIVAGFILYNYTNRLRIVDIDLESEKNDPISWISAPLACFCLLSRFRGYTLL
jgi:hypothetical protein